MKTKFAPSHLGKAVKLALVASVMAMPVAYAQEQAQQQQVEDAEGIEHIEVTSRHRKESLDKIPLSVSTFSSEDIENASMTNINDIASNAIGFSMEKTFGRQSDIPVIRGVSWIPGFGSQKASYFIDGVYYGGSIQSLPLDLIERVEVVKGPQSALYGRRTFSGAINLITKKPTEELSGYATASAGENGYLAMSGGISSEVTDWFGFRASVSTDEYDGDWDNEKEGGPSVGGEETTSYMLGLYFTPGDNTDIALKYIYNEQDDEMQPFMYQDPSYNNCFLDTRAYYCGEAKKDLPINMGGILDNSDYGLETESTHISLRIDHTFDFGTLTYIGGMNDYEATGGLDQTYAGYEQVFNFGFFFTFDPADYFAPADGWHSLDTSEDEEYSHELRFSSTAFDDRLYWSVGAYIWHYEDEPGAVGSFKEERDNTAFMASVSYDVTDDLTISGEIRSSEDEIETASYDTLRDAGYDVDNTFDSTTTRFIAEYNLTDEDLLYVTRSEGNSPGGFNNNELLPTELIVVDEEEMVMYEAGWKTTMFDGDVYLSTAVFFMDWDKQQLTDSYIPEGGGVPISYTSNAGETEIKGIELQGKWNISENFDLDFGFSYTDAEFTEAFDRNHCRFFVEGGSNSACGDPDTLREFGDISGNTPPQVPEKEGVVALNYNTQVFDDWGLFGRVSVNYDSSRYAHVHNFIETGDRTRVDVNLGLQSENWRFQLWGKNVTDDDTPTYVFRYIDAQSFALSSRAFPIAPPRGREFGVTATYRF
ncbi:TonB-dependent receptor [Thalassotalea sp. HSM 43]|uniref:TonB-dependent receptor n=1 Tax=Thalassotalea sp. HSM 43 TaxID=2552945 RepID=UPI0010802B5A|nr:TonB-dependent receptor [Thalassotalea sp. HSM 43]QBY04596.1 TonB-dependent receptor [Thalassotalea sp. HSM 43]